MRTRDLQKRLPRGYSIRRTAHGYVGYLRGYTGPLWSTSFDWDPEKIIAACVAHWHQTVEDVRRALEKMNK